jgi:hypothetical protein
MPVPLLPPPMEKEKKFIIIILDIDTEETSVYSTSHKKNLVLKKTGTDIFRTIYGIKNEVERTLGEF